jgi:anti-anti-sigma regulatory factor
MEGVPAMLISLEVRPEHPLAKLSVHEDIAGMATSRIPDVLRALKTIEITHMIVDLHRLSSIDIRVAAALSRAERKLSARKGSLRLAGAHAAVRQTLNKFGVSDRVQLFTTTIDAGWPIDATRTDLRSERGQHELVTAGPDQTQFS